MNKEYLNYAINDERRLSILGDNAEKVLENIIENLTVGVCLFEVVEEKRVKALYLSNEYFHTIGFKKEDYAENINDITMTVFKEDAIKILDKAKESLVSHKEFDYICRGYKGDNSIAWFRIKGFPMDKIKGKWPVFLAIINDVTGEMKEFENLKELKKIKDELEIETQRYRILQETVEALLFEYIPDKDTMIFSYNFPDNHDRKIIEHYWDVFDVNPMVHQMHIKKFREALLGACKEYTKDKIEYLSEVSGKGYQWHRTYYSSVTDNSGRIKSVMGRIYNINNEINDEKRERGILMIDSLTGAFVRDEGYDRIEKFIKDNNEKEAYLVMIDLDNFKDINDSLGHSTGDKVLKGLAQKMIELIYKDGFVTRFGGDEFIIFTYDISKNELELRVENLRKYAESILQKENVTVEFSVGITRCDKRSVQEIFNDSDKKMYIEKKMKKQAVQ